MQPLGIALQFSVIHLFFFPSLTVLEIMLKGLQEITFLDYQGFCIWEIGSEHVFN